MKYISTRGKKDGVSSAAAIIEGIAADGGLYVPQSIPEINEEFLKELVAADYNTRAAEILKLFMDDFSEEEIAGCIDRAYVTFDEKGVAPVVQPGKKCGETGSEPYMMELWHGPTCAFKDVALQLLPQMMAQSKKKLSVKEKTVILVATSGDTGKAALEGFKDVDGISVIVFFPQNGVSNIQKHQMVSQEGKNVCSVGVNGNFDDTQSGVKVIFGDTEYAKELAGKNIELSSANSINWGRLEPQIVYYFSAYADLVKQGEIKLGDKINFCVPTGNFGDILAGYYAKQMGLPVAKLICASNENRVLTDFFATGTYNRNREFFKTSSPSMDILISSNLERLLYHVTGDSAKVAELMCQLREDGEYTLDPDSMAKINSVFAAGCCDRAETADSIKKLYESCGYVMDTHTAVAYNVYGKYVRETGDSTKTVIVSTASPFKFNSSVLEAIFGASVLEGSTEFELLHVLSDKCGISIPKPLAELEKKPVLHTKTCEKEDMKSMVSAILGI